MELIFVIAKLISGVLYEALRLLFLAIDKMCEAIAKAIKGEYRQTESAEENVAESAEPKDMACEYEEMLAAKKEEAPEPPKHIEL